MALARSKVALIKLAVARLAMEDDAYRELLRRAGAVSSSRDLDEAGFRRVMDEFRRLGFTSDFSRENLGGRAGFATASQTATIRGLWREFAEEGTEAGLNTWIENKFGVSALRFLPKAKVSKVIYALRQMVARRNAA